MSNGSGWIEGSCQTPAPGGTIVDPGFAYPSHAVCTIASRSIAYSMAMRTSGCSSSRLVVFCGLELMMKSRSGNPWPL